MLWSLNKLSQLFLLHWAKYFSSTKVCQSLKALPVAFFVVLKYSCRFGRLHRPCLINKDVIMVPTLLSGTTNEYKFSFILGFQILT